MTLTFGESEFRRVAAEWAAIDSHEAERSAADRSREFDEAWTEYRSLVATGKWVSGPTDLLAVIGRDRDELLHSRLLAWLLTPTGQHRIGDSFLRALMASTWPELTFDSHEGIAVYLEVDRIEIDPETGESVQARADIVVRLWNLTVIMENKVDAVEGVRQCERLYRTWLSEPGEVRWLLLSPTGRPPTTAGEALKAWRSLSYRQVTDLLAHVLETAEPDASLGRASAMQYLATLRRAYPPVGE